MAGIRPQSSASAALSVSVMDTLKKVAWARRKAVPRDAFQELGRRESRDKVKLVRTAVARILEAHTQPERAEVGFRGTQHISFTVGAD